MDAIRTIRVGLFMFNKSGETKDPSKSALPNFIVNIEILVNGRNNWFYLVTLAYFAGIVQKQIS